MGFRQQMLQKLALHLAAQPEPLQEPQREPQSLDAVARIADDRACCHACGLPSAMSSTQWCGAENEFRLEMLRRLALHLAAQPGLGDPNEVGEDRARCECLIGELEPSSDVAKKARRAEIMAWVQSCARTLSFTKSGSRLVQKSIDVATGPEREQLASALLPHAIELYASANANHVLAKLIEVLPPTRLICVAQALRGRATAVARHQYGCRVVERLFEHCCEEQVPSS